MRLLWYKAHLIHYRERIEKMNKVQKIRQAKLAELKSKQEENEKKSQARSVNALQGNTLQMLRCRLSIGDYCYFILTMPLENLRNNEI